MTLTEAAKLTKKSVRYIGIPSLIIFFIWVIIGMLNPKEALPDKYITPDFMCGQLSEIQLDSFSLATPDTTFSIETTSGAIPDLPEVVNVFKYNHPGQSLMALQQAQMIAESLDFDPAHYTRISNVEYEWHNTTTAQTLVIEAGNMNISLTTDFTNPAVDTYSNNLPSEENAKTIAMDYLQSQNLLTKDYSAGNQKTYLIQITPSGEIRQAPSLSEADLIRVDFFREKGLITIDPDLVGTEEIGETLQEELEEEEITTIETDGEELDVKKYTTSVMNDCPIFGNISIYVGGLKNEVARDHAIFGLEYSNWILSAFACGTYKLITPQEAVKKVQSGEAALVYLMEKNGDRIIQYEAKSVKDMTIHAVGLSYLDTSARQDYLQPIFYIQGEARFEN
ncbi:MAG: hypothetical protein U9Q67_03020, partial [Patescibacteria group bacterium]|nr:hypothetical protein [Patescibacteria group bacterium]